MYSIAENLCITQLIQKVLQNLEHDKNSDNKTRQWERCNNPEENLYIIHSFRLLLILTSNEHTTANTLGVVNGIKKLIIKDSTAQHRLSRTPYQMSLHYNLLKTKHSSSSNEAIRDSAFTFDNKSYTQLDGVISRLSYAITDVSG